jgi:hypothetical protein
MAECSIEECHREAKARGWCKAHWIRWKRHGSPTGGGVEKGEPLRFLESILMMESTTNCIQWPFANAGNGYGKVRFRSKWTFAHRAVCFMAHGEPPTHVHQAAHSCGNGHEGCVNPKHLSWKTPKENVADTSLHGTRNKGERNGQCKLSTAQVTSIRKATGKEMQRVLSDRYSVSRATISDIQTRRRWSWL